MKPFPVVEIFGPTIQGEGPLIGVPTMFVFEMTSPRKGTETRRRTSMFSC